MIFSGDTVIKLAIEQGLNDIRTNPWLIDNIMGHFKDPALATYGQKEIDRCKEWFLNNKVEVLLRYRLDKDEFPCVTIALGASSEMEDMKHLADTSTESVVLLPSDINKPISYIIKPFTPTEINNDIGFIGTPESVKIRLIRSGMILVDTSTGNGYEIKDIDENGIFVDPDLNIAAPKMAVVPRFQFYEAKVEHSFFRENYTIGCHVHGDPSTLLWLHAIVSYSLLRYKESLLEGRGFSQTSISSSDVAPNQYLSTPGGENVFSRFITLSGMVENSWIKSPQRIVEAVEIADKNVGSESLMAGIKIISNSNSPSFLNTEEDIGITVED
jgi:hypothetical protein